jgi:hypothetical protein
VTPGAPAMRCARRTVASTPRRMRAGGVVAAMALTAVASACASSAGRAYEQSYLAADHNWVFRNEYPAVDHLFNAFDYGHAIVYETLWRQPGAPRRVLDTVQFDYITQHLLLSPPRLPLEESVIGPEWAKLAPECLEMFHWSHILHRQLYDVLADERLTPERKDAEVARVMRYYMSRRDLAFSTHPKGMVLMEGQPYSLAFRRTYPVFNGLMWSYHWLQMTLYDALMAGDNAAERHANAHRAVAHFWGMVHGGLDSLPTVMPMSPGIAPRFATRYPEAAAVFDNMHSLHDVVSDILTNPLVPRSGKRRRILEAMEHYRDDSTAVETVGQWRAMATMMDVDRMGGVMFPLPASAASESARQP